MEFPEGLKLEIEKESEYEFNNPSTDFGWRVNNLIAIETEQELPEELLFELNNWWDYFVEPVLSFRDFVLWVWRKIKAWWDSLWV